jgi:hypothetical protein
MNAMQSEVLSVLDAYAAAWNERRQVDQANYFYLPTMFVFPTGVTLVKNREECTQYLSTEIGSLSSEQFAHSLYKEREIIILEPHMAIASCNYQRVRVDGTIIEHACATYTLLKTEDGWKITTVVAPHPISTQLRA